MLKQWWRLGGALALAAAAFAGSPPALAQDARDPEVALKELNTWIQQEFAKLTPTSPATARQEIFRQRIERAKAAVKDVDPEKAEPAKGYALAQLFQMAGEQPKAAVAAKRYLTTNPADANIRYSAQNIVLTDLVNKADADGIITLIGEMKPPTASGAASLALMTGARYAGIVAGKKGADAGLGLIAKVEGLVPFDEMLKKPDVTVGTRTQPSPEKTSAEQAIFYLAQGRANILDSAGKTGEALAILEAAGKRLPEGSMAISNLAQSQASILEKSGKKAEALAVLEATAAKFPTGSPARRGLDSKIKLAKIVGSPAPALKQDRGYGEFKSISDYKGKVVIVEFTAHW